MSYITREDGERFVIPSYRDVLSAKKPSLLRREILLLSSNYGEYIALQRKTSNQFEVAFSPDPGYLLGETVWHYFKRPQDLIYCEAIPNTAEAILVIVKSGSVYLDGTFPLDTIPDELVIFRTQRNNFEVYISGDVPISNSPEDGKYTLDTSSVKSFTVLDRPVFPQLPLVKAFQLQLVDAVLKAKGIGVFPMKRILLVVALLGLLWLGWTYVTTHKKELPQVIMRAVVNPYQTYFANLSTPNPTDQLRWISSNVWLLSTIPGWRIDTINFSDGVLRASVKSLGARTDILFQWAAQNHAAIEVMPDGFYLVIAANFVNRPTPTTINKLNEVVATLIDSLSYVTPGNNMEVGELVSRGRFSERQLIINFNDITLPILELITQQLKNLPLVLTKVSMKMSDGFLSGSITLIALGS